MDNIFHLIFLFIHLMNLPNKATEWTSNICPPHDETDFGRIIWMHKKTKKCEPSLIIHWTPLNSQTQIVRTKVDFWKFICNFFEHLSTNEILEVFRNKEADIPFIVLSCIVIRDRYKHEELESKKKLRRLPQLCIYQNNEKPVSQPRDWPNKVKMTEVIGNYHVWDDTKRRYTKDETIWFRYQ